MYYLLADHLGGTNVTVSTAGVENGEVRYRAFGETRYSSGTTPTTFRYTGQREEQSLGLYFYNARFYDPYLNRWIQPDTIIPDPGNPLDYDRFAYVRNNPLKYVDPTGHFSDEEITGFFGVETWDDVLAYFQDGGAYEGKWGWLGFLKAAQDGSTYDWTSNAGFQYDFFEMTTARSQMEHHGSLSIVDGRLVFGESEELSMFTVLQEGNFAALDGLVWETNRDPVKFLKFDSSNVDWGDTAYDATSLGLSVFGLGTATKWKDLAKGAREISSIMSGAGAAESLTVNQYTDTLLGVGGVLPWPLVSVPCSIASVYFDLEPGFYWGP